MMFYSKEVHMKQTILTLLAIMCSVMFWSAFAKPEKTHHVKLYQSPQDNAKVVAKVKSGEAIIPIITKDDQWLKAAKADNGKVGWIKRQDLEKTRDKPKTHHMTITEKTGDNGKHTIHYSGTEKLSKKEMKQLMQQFHRQQRQMAKRMNVMVDQMNKEMNALENMFNEPFFQNELEQPKQAIQPIIIKDNKGNKQNQAQNDQGWWQKLKNKL